MDHNDRIGTRCSYLGDLVLHVHLIDRDFAWHRRSGTARKSRNDGLAIHEETALFFDDQRLAGKNPSARRGEKNRYPSDRG